MIRSILGIVVALVAVAVLVLGLTMGLWAVLGVDGVLRPGTFEGTPLLEPSSVLFSLIGAAVGGVVCAAISRSRTAVLVLALLMLVMGAANGLGQWSKPEPGPRGPGTPMLEAIGRRKEPAWFTILVPIIGPITALAAGGAFKKTGPQRNAP